MLLDTGALVALLDRSERNHPRCVEVLRRFHGQLLTTEPVLTETVYLLGPSFYNQDPALRFFLLGGAELVPLTPKRLARTRELMERYADVPMDLADATLVALAEELRIYDVFTLGRRGFSAYRASRNRAFRIVP
ncbi:type II toxin-antitoxin system VapC family toxin [Deferrisoma camini]|uniref:type II toxin-antitoxin system VapC family toxin n=1 Tax=Deferrisoma camini TaxID=1035120 RepID=UPI00046CF620|nr:PIN domain-containing protein [Deferrisoma camini]